MYKNITQINWTEKQVYNTNENQRLNYTQTHTQKTGNYIYTAKYLTFVGRNFKFPKNIPKKLVVCTDDRILNSRLKLDI